MEHLEEQALEFYSAEHSEKLKILKKTKKKQSGSWWPVKMKYDPTACSYRRFEK